MRRSDEISSEMGKLMLQRWTMLSESCTDCAVCSRFSLSV